MCRHLAYLGAPVSVAEVLVEPAYGLYRQSWAPRLQRYGTVNADGFGLGWYVEGDPRPVRYRRAVPIWADENLTDLARAIHSTALLAAVRSATPAPARTRAPPRRTGVTAGCSATTARSAAGRARRRHWPGCWRRASCWSWRPAVTPHWSGRCCGGDC